MLSRDFAYLDNFKPARGPTTAGGRKRVLPWEDVLNVIRSKLDIVLHAQEAVVEYVPNMIFPLMRMILLIKETVMMVLNKYLMPMIVILGLFVIVSINLLKN